MSLIVWKTFLSVGIDEIDQQHKQLISIINELNESMLSGQGKFKLEKILDDLIEYSCIHFKTEEYYFEKYQYFGRKEHIKEHRLFNKNINEYYFRYHTKHENIVLGISEFTAEWFHKHLLDMDMKYSDFLKDRI